jgi:radical SAM protein with 4Fe4S-binding SPASM domain
MRRNIEELPQLIENADQLGIKEVVLSDMFPPSEELAQESLFYCRDLADSVIERCKSIAKEHRINFISPSVFHDPELATKGNMVLNVAKSKSEGTEGDHSPHPRRGDAPQNKGAKEAQLKNPYPCYEPWQTLYVTHDGNVRPCCVINESFGSLLNETISEIWNNEKYRLLRESVNTLSPVFEGCRGCLLRRRVHFSAREGLFIWLRYVQNNGLFHTIKKTLRYMMEYF